MITATVHTAGRNIFLNSFFILVVTGAYAQPALQYQAIITTEGREQLIKGSKADSLMCGSLQQYGDKAIETAQYAYSKTGKNVIYVKGDMTKTVLNLEAGHDAVIRDNASSTEVLLFNRTKRGLYTTDEERIKHHELQRFRFGINKDSAGVFITAVELEQKTDTQVIAGFTCHKVVARLIFNNGYRDSSVFWYSSALFFEHIIGTTGYGTMYRNSRVTGNMAIDALDKLNGFGFIMAQDSYRMEGLRYQTRVTGLDVKKKIKDREFEIPEDYVLKPLF